jgi:hypothetical protein
MTTFSRLVSGSASFLALSSIAPAATLAHRYSFNNASDSVGGANAVLVGGASFTGGQLELPGGGPRTNYATLPISSTLAANASLTVEAWFTLDNLSDWSKIWMFGTPGAENALSYIGFTPRMGASGNVPKVDFDSSISAIEFNTAGGTNPAVMGSATEYYVATIFDSASDTMSFYINGVLADSASMGGGNVTQLNTTQNFLGAAVNFGDPDIDGRINELRIWSGALTPAQVAQNNALGPNVVPEPATGMIGLCAGAAILMRRRKSR